MKLLMIIPVLTIIIVILFKKEHFENVIKTVKTVKDPCNDFLSDNDYLIHMIPHHQVAIDMCKLMIPISKSRTIQHI